MDRRREKMRKIRRLTTERFWTNTDRQKQKGTQARRRGIRMLLRSCLTTIMKVRGLHIMASRFTMRLWTSAMTVVRNYFCL